MIKQNCKESAYLISKCQILSQKLSQKSCETDITPKWIVCLLVYY